MSPFLSLVKLLIDKIDDGVEAFGFSSNYPEIASERLKRTVSKEVIQLGVK